MRGAGTVRHLGAILALPFVVTVVVPTWLVRSGRGAGGWWTVGLPAQAVGLVLFAAGFALFARCVWLFSRVGRGTLAPWDPTRRLVVVGPYRHVRNPMISGVLAMLLGEGLASGSLLVLAWAAAFFLLNHAYFVASEEPGLRRRFGDDFRTYAANVPRWIPRLSPWRGPTTKDRRHPI